VLNYRQKSAAKPDLSISLEFKQRSKGGKGFPTGSPSFFSLLSLPCRSGLAESLPPGIERRVQRAFAHHFGFEIAVVNLVASSQ
jgi:hypothetical protein